MVSILEVLIPVYINEYYSRRTFPPSWPRKVADGKILVEFYKPRFANRLVVKVQKHDGEIELADIDITGYPEGWNRIEIPCSKIITDASVIINGTSMDNVDGFTEQLASGTLVVHEFSKEVEACISASGYETECVTTKVLALSSRIPLEVTISLSEPVTDIAGFTTSLVTHELVISVRKNDNELSFSTTPLHVLRSIQVNYMELGGFPFRLIRLNL